MDKVKALLLIADGLGDRRFGGLGSQVPRRGDEGDAFLGPTRFGHQDAAAVGRAGGLDADLDQFELPRVLLPRGVEEDAAEAERAVQLAVVLAAEPPPALARRRGAMPSG